MSGDPTSYEGKAHMVWWSEITFALADALGICRFAQQFNTINHLGTEEFSRLLYYATGIQLSADELITIGERIITLEKMFLQREGIDRRYDTLPDRLLNQRVFEGPARGQTVRLRKMLREYYDLRGWTQDGVPEQWRLKEYGLLGGE